MTAIDPPVPWELDPYHRAKKIKCAVCNICEWHPNSNVCAFGGPYLGYIERKKEKK